MKKTFILIFLVLFITGVSFALTPIYGTLHACIGDSSLLHSSKSLTSRWSSSDITIAAVGSTSGMVTGISTGTATITYTDSSTYVTATFSVSGTLPAPITGTGTICPTGSLTLADATPGGSWSSGSWVATVGSSTGIVTGVAGGYATISYTVGGCSAITGVTVSPLSYVAIHGPATVCASSTITITDSMGSTVTWTSSAPSVATVSGGVVTGLTTGVTVISLTVTNACGSTTDTMSVTVLTTTPTPGAISGPSTVMAGSTITLSNSVPGGVWSSSNTSIATVSSGYVYGVTAGTVIITYTITGCSGPLSVTTTITVTPFNGISGHVLFTGATYKGYVKVWLITYNPTTLDLQAVDSIYVYSSGTSASYSFPGVVTDSYRVKAATPDTVIGISAYIPTYHTSSYYWYSANTIWHTIGTTDINKDITMIYGTTSGGPGFIGGNVTTGANKGTSGGVAVGLRMYLLDASGAMVQQTKTDASGNYSFSSLPLGTYQVFPEALNYLTTPYTGITLTSGAASKSASNFVQHTISHTITPVAAAINAPASAAAVAIYPNPSNGKLNLSWNIQSAETGKITVTDITGREVYTTSATLSQVNGVHQLDLSSLINGVYLINIRSGSINYMSKVTIAH